MGGNLKMCAQEAGRGEFGQWRGGPTGFFSGACARARAGGKSERGSGQRSGQLPSIRTVAIKPEVDENGEKIL